MKRIVVLVAIIVIGLAGCSTKTDVINNDIENIQNDNSVQNDNNDNISKDDSSIQKYKFSEDYSIDFNVWKKEFGTTVVENSKVISDNKINSDGEDIELRFETELMEENTLFATKFTAYVNDIAYAMEDTYIYSAILFDLDENDNYKEIYICKTDGMDSEYETYRIKKDGLELIYNSALLYNDTSKQYIGGFETVIDGVNPTPVLGYYLYEDGEFKYIDRFLNGEKITDEFGNLNQNFKDEIFTVNVETSGLNTEDSIKNLNIINDAKDIPNDMTFLARAKVRFVREYNEIDSYGYETKMYDIEIVEDFTNTYYYDFDTKEQEITIPAGTILKGITSWSNAGGEYYNLMHRIEQ